MNQRIRFNIRADARSTRASIGINSGGPSPDTRRILRQAKVTNIKVNNIRRIGTC
jgi:hypothetical protein